MTSRTIATGVHDIRSRHHRLVRRTGEPAALFAGIDRVTSPCDVPRAMAKVDPEIRARVTALEERVDLLGRRL
jgi:hypothetical protein